MDWLTTKYQKAQNGPTRTEPCGAPRGGGIGVLMKAYATDKVSKTCYLVMGHESETYIGALILENVVFCQHLCSVFQENVGRTLSEIGSLDLAYTL